MSVDEIYEHLLSILDHDEFDAQQRRQVRYTGRRKAEYIEIVLFVCPECRNIGTMQSEGDVVSCAHCGYSARVNSLGSFEPVSGPLHFPNLRRWNLWQVQYFEGVIDQAVEERRVEPILSEEGVRIREGFKSQPLEFRGLGRLTLTVDQLHLDASDGKGDSLTFEVGEIEGINVQNSEFLEFYYRGSLYQIKILKPGGNSYKWNLAVRHLQGRAKATLKRERSSAP